MAAAFDYVSKYHSLSLVDHVLGLATTVKVEQYYTDNGVVRPRVHKEKSALWKALKKLGIDLVSKTFYFPKSDLLANEPFYKPGFDRVFMGRGSPSEIWDVLRLAWRAGRIGTGGVRPDLTSYVRDFITCDCNGFMGNLFNLSPHMHIANWASAHAADTSDEKLKEKGWLEADRLTKGYLPLTPVNELWELEPNDVIITVDLKKKGMSRYEHIAILEGISPAGNGKHFVEVVEWGRSGEWNHYNYEEVTVVEGPEVPSSVNPAKYKGKKYGLGWIAKTKYKEITQFRYFFKKPCPPNPATWGRCGFWDV